MTTDPAKPAIRATRIVLPAVFLLAFGGMIGLVAMSRGRELPNNSNARGDYTSGSSVVSITLPYDEPDLPPGPHLREFQVACTSCHSTRLVMTQPPFPKAKWEASVKKMVDAFGAPLTPAVQARVVEYLMAVRGK
jgi:hypothetical protein